MILFFQRNNEMYLLAKYHTFKEGVPEEEWPQHMHTLLSHNAHPYLCSKKETLQLLFYPVTLIRRDWRGSEPHLPCALVINIHWTAFFKASFALHVQLWARHCAKHFTGMASYNFHDSPTR